MLKCPRCRGKTTLSHYRSGDEAHLRGAPLLREMMIGASIQVSCCPTCAGLWLAEGDLRSLLQQTALEKEDPLELALTMRRWARERAMQDDPEAPCPGCGAEMLRHEWKQSQVMVDRCLDCAGLWLDGDELDKIERYFATFG